MNYTLQDIHRNLCHSACHLSGLFRWRPSFASWGIFASRVKFLLWNKSRIPEDNRQVGQNNALIYKVYIDFLKGLPSTLRKKNESLLFSRFPFAFICRNISSPTVMVCLCQLFIFGILHYTCSDWGSYWNRQVDGR